MNVLKGRLAALCVVGLALGGGLLGCSSPQVQQSFSEADSKKPQDQRSASSNTASSTKDTNSAPESRASATENAPSSSSSSTSEQAQNTTPKKTQDVSSQEFVKSTTIELPSI